MGKSSKARRASILDRASEACDAYQVLGNCTAGSQALQDARRNFNQAMVALNTFVKATKSSAQKPKIGRGNG